MADKPTWEQIKRDRDNRVALPLDPSDALSGLLEVATGPDPSDGPKPEEPAAGKPSAPS